MKVAVTGAAGRLGRALVTAATTTAPPGTVGETLRWSRPGFDLDRPQDFGTLVARERPDFVIHAAAWTDVDGCAREPALARRRNGEATAALAAACALEGIGLLLVSTNEVFDGRRTDGHGYAPDDPTGPINAYGESKLAGEEGARAMFADTSNAPGLTIVRTAWLFGPPGADFPMKIRAAAERARAAGEPLRVVADEIGSPTYSADLASAIVRFVAAGQLTGTFHVVNAGRTSRSGWAREVMRLSGSEVEIVEIRSDEWERPSRAPAWAVLEPSQDFGPLLRDWHDALGAYVKEVSRTTAASA